MSDRQLLELAAKAAGIDGIYDHDFDMLVLLDSEVVPTMWNPLKDDGDALRLAVQLGLYVMPICRHEETQVFRQTGYVLERWRGDPSAATRRAIVRAAAEIGKAKP